MMKHNDWQKARWAYARENRLCPRCLQALPDGYKLRTCRACLDFIKVQRIKREMKGGDE